MSNCCCSWCQSDEHKLFLSKSLAKTYGEKCSETGFGCFRHFRVVFSQHFLSCSSFGCSLFSGANVLVSIHRYWCPFIDADHRLLEHLHGNRTYRAKMSSAIDRPSNNDNSKPEDALIPERAPRITTEVQRSPAPSHANNQNLFAVLVKNRRQITSLTAGIHARTHTLAHHHCANVCLSAIFYIIVYYSALGLS